MHFQTIAFERIFSVRRFQWYGIWNTEFGFVAAGNTHYTARVPGYPTIEAGDTVTAVIRVPDRWTTVMGWLNHSSGEYVYAQAQTSWIGRVGLGAVVGLLLFLALGPQASHLSPSQQIPMMCAACTCLLLLCVNLIHTLRAIKARQPVEGLRRQHAAAAKCRFNALAAQHVQRRVNG